MDFKLLITFLSFLLLDQGAYAGSQIRMVTPYRGGVWQEASDLGNSYKYQKYKYDGKYQNNFNHDSIVLLDKTYYLLGGWDKMSQKTVKNVTTISARDYDISRNNLIKGVEMIDARRDFSAITFRGKIYVFGGINEDGVMETCEVFDPKKSEWESISPMEYARRGSTAVVAENYIYVIGGEKYEGQLDVVERYDPENDWWETVTKMPSRRKNAAAAYHNGLIYVAGGFSASEGGVLKTMFAYNVKSNSWKHRRQMNYASVYGSMTFQEGYLWFMGGLTKLLDGNSVCDLKNCAEFSLVYYSQRFYLNGNNWSTYYAPRGYKGIIRWKNTY